MPVEGNTQPYGLLHGGASVVLAETLGSIGAALHAGPDRVAVGLDINASHHRAARVRAGDRRRYAGARRVDGRRRYQVEVTDDDGPPRLHRRASPACSGDARRAADRRGRGSPRPGDRSSHAAQRATAGDEVVGERRAPRAARGAAAGR